MNSLANSVMSKNRFIFLLNYKIFVILLFIIPLYLFNNIVIKSIGYFASLCIFLFALFDFIIRNKRIKLTRTWVWYFILFSYNFILMIRHVSVNSIYIFLLQSVLFLFITLLSSMNLDDVVLSRITQYGRCLFIIILIPSIFIIINGSDIRLFDKYFNFVMYKFMFPCTFFFLVNNKYKFLKTVLFSLVFLLMTERTLAITTMIIYIIYVIIGKLTRNRYAYIVFLASVFIGIIGFTYLYVYLQYTGFGYSINQIFRTYTGGNFFSGRNSIWEVAFKYISEAKYFGYGLDHNITRISGIDKSVHNTYLYMLLQGGIVGLTFFFIFILSLWKKYYSYLNNHVVRLSASYLIGILVYINFEVSLIGNTVGPGIFMWLVIGVGLIYNNNQKQKSDYMNS